MCNSDSDDEEKQTCLDEAESDDAAGGRDQCNNVRVSIKQVQERQQPAEAEDATSKAAKVSDMESTASSVRRSTRAAKQPEALTHSHGQLAQCINDIESIVLGKQKAKNNSATTEAPRPTTTHRSITFEDKVKEHTINCVHDIVTQAWDENACGECTPEHGSLIAC